MAEKKDLPLIVLEDGRILAETEHPKFEEAREVVAQFASLKESPEFVHTYEIDNVSLWNAASLHNLTGEEIVRQLEEWSKYPLPEGLASEIQTVTNRLGKLTLRRPLSTEDQFEGNLVLSSPDPQFFKEVLSDNRVQPFIDEQPASDIALVNDVSFQRGFLKQILGEIGYPIQDQIGVEKGEKLEFSLCSHTKEGEKFKVRNYQKQAADRFLTQGDYGGGYGVVLLPPGTGKTIVGLEILRRIEECALILCTDTIAVRQWIEELLDKTTLTKEQVGEYTGDKKQIKPVTVGTYHIAIQSVREYLEELGEQGEITTHFQLFNQFDWGLIAYDEVHRLPAQVFRLTAELQARRRLGLTATFIREDRREEDVFSLIGPLRFQASWGEMEESGWIAEAICREVKVSLPEEDREVYNIADLRRKFRIASENPRKIKVLKEILGRTRAGDKVLVIGYFLDQLRRVSQEIDAPLIEGRTPYEERENLYHAFRKDEIRILCLSNVGNYAIDLPSANVAIELSGTGGSRQEEGQRLGRILRPKTKENIAQFYALVSEDTREEIFANRRQRYLVQQGYTYSVQGEEEYI